MRKIKKGDIVGRKSYNKDIIFVVERIIKSSSGKEIAILKGMNIRIQADSNLEDLEIFERLEIEKQEEKINKRFEAQIKKNQKKFNDNLYEKRINKVIYTGRILHLDGDSHLSNLKKSSNTNTSKQVIFSHI